jgi:hypothetical protein
MTLFALDTPWRLFRTKNETMRQAVKHKCLAGLNRWLAEPIEDCLALARNGAPCLEAKSPVDIEEELGHFRGNIFHGALAFPFAETPEAAGSWGVETEFQRHPGSQCRNESARNTPARQPQIKEQAEWTTQTTGKCLAVILAFIGNDRGSWLHHQQPRRPV